MTSSASPHRQAGSQLWDDALIVTFPTRLTIESALQSRAKIFVRHLPVTRQLGADIQLSSSPCSMRGRANFLPTSLTIFSGGRSQAGRDGTWRPRRTSSASGDGEFRLDGADEWDSNPRLRSGGPAPRFGRPLEFVERHLHQRSPGAALSHWSRKDEPLAAMPITRCGIVQSARVLA